MSITLALYSGTAVSISTTELSLTLGTTSGTPASKTDVGVFELDIDPANMAAGDEYEVRLYDKIRSGGTQRSVVLGNLVGAQSGFAKFHVGFLGYGWDITMKKIAGTDRAFDWTIRAAQ